MFPCWTHNSIEQPTQQNIISVGQFTIVHKLNNKIVRKVPLDESYYSIRAVEIEGQIYNHLGKNRRVARCINWGDNFINLRYEYNGDLESYLKKNRLNDCTRYRMARQAVEAVVFAHEKDVIHSDLSARQFLVDRRCNLRLSDFGGSSLRGSDAIVMETATHFLPRDEDKPNTIQSDIFALGSTIYEIIVGEKPYEKLKEDEVQRLYSENQFPTLDKIQDPHWRRVIQKCWRCEYKLASDIFADIASQRTWPNLADLVDNWKRRRRGYIGTS